MMLMRLGAGAGAVETECHDDDEEKEDEEEEDEEERKKKRRWWRGMHEWSCKTSTMLVSSDLCVGIFFIKRTSIHQRIGKWGFLEHIEGNMLGYCVERFRLQHEPKDWRKVSGINAKKLRDSGARQPPFAFFP